MNVPRRSALAVSALAAALLAPLPARTHPHVFAEAHLDAEDSHAAQTLARNGFADTGEPPYPGVARWALCAAA